MKKRIVALFIIILVFLSLGSFAYAFRFKFYEWQKDRIAAKLPPAISLGQLKPSQNKPVVTTSSSLIEPTALTTLPDEINLAVPFTPQAPYAVWDAFHNDACEEASVLMVARFWQNKPIGSPALVEKELQEIKAYEDKIFGYDQDTTASETAKILTDYYHLKEVRVLYNVTLDDVRHEVLAGRPVIIPAAGRELNNPFFKQPGPTYHMLVIKGVTADGKFITNDPGTKRGADFVYGQTALYNAINDWDNITHNISGRKAMITVSSF